MATSNKARKGKGKPSKGKPSKGKARTAKPKQDRAIAALPFQGNGIIAGVKGSTFLVSGVEYRGYLYPSLWTVWGKKGRYQDANHSGPEGLDIGSRSQCITFRKTLRAAKPGTWVEFNNEKAGHKGSNKVHKFRTIKPGQEA